jgi:hypothetical protein
LAFAIVKSIPPEGESMMRTGFVALMRVGPVVAREDTESEPCIDASPALAIVATATRTARRNRRRFSRKLP